MGLWSWELIARYLGGLPRIDWSLPPSWIHALFLVYGFFGCFVLGFIFTAGPRWQRQSEIAPKAYQPVIFLLTIGWLFADFGLIQAWLLPLGLIIVAIAWILASRIVWRLFLESGSDRMHIGVMAVAITVGCLGLLGFSSVTLGQLDLGRITVQLSIWIFLLPVFITVLHRMLPFFSRGTIPDFPILSPNWPFAVLLIASVSHGVMVWLEQDRLTWCVDLPAALSVFHLSWLWRLRASLVDRLLAVLHIGLAWLGITFLLFTFHSALLFIGKPGLGLAPVHALTIGFFSSTMIAMGTRVSLGHSGQRIVADLVMWGVFWAMQLTALLRIAAEILEPNLNIIAVLLWWLALWRWAIRYWPSYWKPRLDGLPG